MRTLRLATPLALAAAIVLSGCARAADTNQDAAVNAKLDAITENLRDMIGQRMLRTPGFVLPANSAELDAALARGDFTATGQAYRAVSNIDDLTRLANWSRYHVMRGEGGFGIAYMYAATLFDMARAAEASPNAGSAAPGLKQAAAAQLLYAVALTYTDGARCTDFSAPQQKRQDILRMRAAILDVGRKLPAPARAAAVKTALDQEEGVAGLRAPDLTLCSGGLADMGAALAAGTARPVAAPPAVPGSASEVSPSARAAPFLPSAGQYPAMDKARTALPGQLRALLDAPSGA